MKNYSKEYWVQAALNSLVLARDFSCAKDKRLTRAARFLSLCREI